MAWDYTIGDSTLTKLCPECEEVPAVVNLWKHLAIAQRIIRVKLVQTNYYAKVIDELDDENDRLKFFEKWARENVEPSVYEGFVHCPSTTFRDREMWEMLKGRPAPRSIVRFGELPRCPGCEKREIGRDRSCSASSCIRPRMEPAQDTIALTQDEGHIVSKLRDDPDNTTSTTRKDGTVKKNIPDGKEADVCTCGHPEIEHVVNEFLFGDSDIHCDAKGCICVKRK